MSLEQWRKTIDINLTGYFLFSREFLKQLKTSKNSQPANIVMIGSTAGIFGEAGHADYATSKSGLMYGFLYSLKNEIVHVVPKSRVNVVARKFPFLEIIILKAGWVATKMAEKALNDKEVVSKVYQTMPMR